jgi:plastocyanin domain-containing protein
MTTKRMFAAAVLSLLLIGSEGAWAAKKMKPKVKAKAIALFVTEDGFVPQILKLKKGVAYDLVVTRQTDKTCAKQIDIPGCALKDLPLDVPVKIAFVSKRAGELDYSCGMGMLHGVLSVE